MLDEEEVNIFKRKVNSKIESSQGQPHPDWERNYDTAKRIIQDNEGKLPLGMSMRLDKFRVEVAFQSPFSPTYATPIPLHQDMLTFNPELRYQFAYYKKNAEVNG